MAKLGNERKCYIGTALSGTWTWLVGEQTNSFSRSAAAVETSDKSSAWQKFISGLRGATADVTVFTDDTDAQQKAALAAFNEGSTIFVFIGELSSASPSAGDAFEAVITAINDTNDNASVSTRQMSLQVTGAPVHYPTA